MKCPWCSVKMRKARLDVYFCRCGKSWLIHKLSYKTFKEASITWEEDYKEKHNLKTKILFTSPSVKVVDLTVPPKLGIASDKLIFQRETKS